MAKAKHSLRLLSVMVLMSIALNGCGGTTQSDTNDIESAESDSLQTTDIYSNLPTADYDGETFTIYNDTMTYAETRLDSESQIGDVMNDAVYNRTRELEEYLNIEIALIEQDMWTGTASYLTNIIMAGDDSIDAAYVAILNAGPMTADSLFVDLYTVDEIDFDKPWWDERSRKYFELDGKLFMAHGDASVCYLDCLWVTFFNKDLYENLNTGTNLYELVNSGGWTLDRLNELIEIGTNDLNGDGFITDGDQYGLGTHNGAAFGLLHGCDERGIETENGIPFVADVDENMFNAINKIKEVITSNGVMLATPACLEQFDGGKLLFMMEVLGNASNLRESQTDFGIIPFPKYDEKQENYISYESPSATAAMIPVSCKDVARSGLVLEVMQALSSKTIVPAYYEMVLAGKNTRDDESVEMLDLMFENIECEMSYVYQWGGYHSKLISAITTSVDVISTLESVHDSVEKALEDFLADIG